MNANEAGRLAGHRRSTSCAAQYAAWARSQGFDPSDVMHRSEYVAFAIAFCEEAKFALTCEITALKQAQQHLAL